MQILSKYGQFLIILAVKFRTMQIKAYTPKEYGEKKKESAKTVIRRIETKQLPSNVEAVKVGRCWIILVGF